MLEVLTRMRAPPLPRRYPTTLSRRRTAVPPEKPTSNVAARLVHVNLERGRRGQPKRDVAARSPDLHVPEARADRLERHVAGSRLRFELLEIGIEETHIPGARLELDDETGTLRGDQDLDNLRGDPRYRRALDFARARERQDEKG